MKKRRASVSWTKNTIVTLSPKPARSETLPTSQPTNEGLKEVRRDSASLSKHSSLRSIDELEREDPIDGYRPASVSQVRRNVNQLKYNNNSMKNWNKSSMESDQNKDFIPLYSTKYQPEYSRIFSENLRAVKYHFPSTTGNTSGKQQIYRQEQRNIHRIYPISHCQNWSCFNRRRRTY